MQIVDIRMRDMQDLPRAFAEAMPWQKGASVSLICVYREDDFNGNTLVAQFERRFPVEE